MVFDKNLKTRVVEVVYGGCIWAGAMSRERVEATVRREAGAVSVARMLDHDEIGEIWYVGNSIVEGRICPVSGIVLVDLRKTCTR